jgi:hypothetical protein
MEIVQGGELWTYIYEKTSLLPRSKAGGFNVKEAQFYSGYVHMKKHMRLGSKSFGK